MLHVSSSYEEL